MSWSDDIRCLYCDGRLPLYRKITHGQFCSSAHRKAYWQEQERLAVERLNQTHNSLQAYRKLVPLDLTAAPASGPELVPPPLDVEDWRDTPAPVPPEVAPPWAGFLFEAVNATTARWSAGRVRAGDTLALLFQFPAASPRIDLGDDISAGQLAEDAAAWAPAAPEEVLVPAAPEVKPPFAGFIFTTVAVAPPCTVGTARSDDAVATLLQFPVARPRIDLTVAALPAPAPEPPQVTVLPGMLESESDAPFADRMFGLTLGSARAASLAHPTQPFAVDFPPVAYVPQSDPRAKSSLTSAGAVEARWNAPRAQAGQRSPVASVLEQLESRSNVAVAGRIGNIGVQACEMRLAPPVELRFQPETVAPPAAGEPKIRETIESAIIPAADIAMDLAGPMATPSAVVQIEWNPPGAGLLKLSFRQMPAARDQEMSEAGRAADHPGSLAALYSLPQPSKVAVMLPQSGLEVLDAKPVTDAFPDPLAGWPGTNAPGLGAPSADFAPGIAPDMSPGGLHRQSASWKHLASFWKQAPRDLRMLVIAIPALIALVFHPSPKVSLRAPQHNPIGGILGAQLANVKQSLVERAAVALDEDFRSGLDGWVSRGNATAAWSFDATGFVQPGPLALYQPSIGLSDYQMQFLGMIDQKALSWVVRAADFENYYVIKLVVLKPGPLPEIGLTRYAVINGQAQNRADTIVPISARPDMLYRVQVDVNGDDYVVDVQGEIVDSWSEPRLRRGGIGFFSARGEQSRVRWVQVTHQYDMLGRLCAYLAPYNIPSNGSW